MRVLVTGDRHWGERDLFSEVRSGMPYSEGFATYRALGTLDPETDFVVLGDADGADEIAHRACHEYGLPHSRHEADWEKYGRAAGPIRNSAMLGDLGKESLEDPEPREVWWFHKDLDSSKGTKNCVKQARARGVTTRDGREVGR